MKWKLEIVIIFKVRKRKTKKKNDNLMYKENVKMNWIKVILINLFIKKWNLK